MAMVLWINWPLDLQKLDVKTKKQNTFVKNHNDEYHNMTQRIRYYIKESPINSFDCSRQGVSRAFKRGTRKAKM